MVARHEVRIGRQEHGRCVAQVFGRGRNRHARLEQCGVNFFPVRGEEARPAKAICARCLVKDQCLAYALDNGDKFGIWGGLSERERRRLRRSAA
ncbi:MAG: WhiB family transcriptional regulator [Acidimicrobiia bacterium]|nr:WhiB family transcriptional regulator [Acidimicrobiia bacterium]